MTARNKCQYAFWCSTCKVGFVSLPWVEKEHIKLKHKHEDVNKLRKGSGMGQ